MHRAYRPLVLATLLLTYVLIVVGAATRVGDAGLSCPDWPHCYGLWFPFTPTHLAQGFLSSTGYTYAWWQVGLEWSHRLLALLSSLGLLAILALTPLQTNKPLKPLIAAVILLGTQITLGGVTVLQGNINWSVALHLGNAMLFLGSLFWLYRSTGENPPAPSWRAVAPAKLRILAAVMAGLVWATMIVGAFVSSSHAGGVCGGLFSCMGQWMPKDFTQHLHMQHRYLALTTFVFTIVTLSATKRLYPIARKRALLIHLVASGQVALGILTLYSFANYAQFYQVLSVTHLAWGTLFFLSTLNLLLALPKNKKAHAA